MNGAIVITWGDAKAGREAKGLEVFGKALEYYDSLAKAGQVHGHKEYIAVTGRTRGLMVVEGELEELLKLQAKDESLALQTQAAAICQDFQVQIFSGGNEASVQDRVGKYATTLNELGLF